MSQAAPKNVSLFVTCVVDQFFPEVGESTVRVLRRHGIDVDFDPDQTCCGQPAFNTGYWKEARPLAERFLDMYEDVDYVVMPSGSCASMVRVFYQELFHDDPTLLRRAAEVGSHVFELSEFLVDVLGTDSVPGNVAVRYDRSRDLSRGVPSEARVGRDNASPQAHQRDSEC